MLRRTRSTLAAESGVCWSLDPRVVVGLASRRSRAAACRRARARSTRRTARGRCRARRPRSSSVLAWPGTTSFLPASSGTQNEWITLLRRAGVQRATGPVRPGCASRWRCTNRCRLSVYSYCHHHWRAVDVTCTTFGPVGHLGEVEDRGDRRDRHHREDQERDDRPADLEHGVAVDLHRAAVLARAARGSAPRRRWSSPTHADADHDRDPEERRRSGSRILCAAGPCGLQRVLACCSGPVVAAAREHDDGDRRCRRPSRPRAGAVACGPTSASLAEPDRRESQPAATLQRPIRRIATL